MGDFLLQVSRLWKWRRGPCRVRAGSVPGPKPAAAQKKAQPRGGGWGGGGTPLPTAGFGSEQRKKRKVLSEKSIKIMINFALFAFPKIPKGFQRFPKVFGDELAPIDIHRRWRFEALQFSNMSRKFGLFQWNQKSWWPLQKFGIISAESKRFNSLGTAFNGDI